MRTQPLGPSVESLAGPQAVREGCADACAVGACGRSRWGGRWSSLWSQEACERCADMGAVGACE
eukprot:1171134-Pyramimonas_sp.AAC.1